jgi:2-polyprenyl-3-methyl-5-hydroxy-6-metoxy-1,4-benzoquinol methylase
MATEQTPKTDAEFFAWNEEMAVKYNPDAYHQSGNVVVRWIEATRVRRILSMLGAFPNHRVLEVGVGAGNILAQIPVAQRSGIDLSPFLLRIARTRLPDAHLYEGDAEQFPAELRTQRFDRVYCSEVLEHVRHPERVVAEMAEVLEPNGIAVISVPNERVINAIKGFMLKLNVFRLLFPKLSTKMDDEWHLHTFDRALLRKTVEQSLVLERIDAVPFSWLPIRLVARLHSKTQS